MSGGPGDVKICASCGRAMAWRKAWAKNWADVRYCSSACRSRKLKAVDQAQLTRAGRRFASVSVTMWQGDPDAPIAAAHGHFALVTAP